MHIDLGCGRDKYFGFIGVDRTPLPGVDIVADLNAPLPFPDDSADLIVASHSLEHVSNLIGTMQEIYRIAKHGGQVCIIAPYSEQKLNLANPYHKAIFNEHTPRFWTAYPHCPIDAEDFYHPHALQWGLSMSDNSDPGIDLRTFRMQHFYFPEYRSLPEEEVRRLRRERLDVCDVIVYNLIVWKAPWQGRDEAFDQYVRGVVPFEPPAVQRRRTRELEELVRIRDTDIKQLSANHTTELEEASEFKAQLQEELETARAQWQRESAALKLRLQEQSGSAERVKELLADRDRSDMLVRELRAHSHQLSVDLSAAHNDNLSLRSELLAARTALAQATEMQASAAQTSRAQLALSRAEAETASVLLEIARTTEERLRAELSLVSPEHVQIEAESLAGLRVTPLSVTKIGPFALGRAGRTEDTQPGLASLVRYSHQHFPGAKRSVVVLSNDLRSLPYIEYQIPFEVDTLASVTLGFRQSLRGADAGLVGIEIVTSGSTIVAHVTLAIRDLPDSGIAEFHLPVPLTLQRAWFLRVFVQGSQGPVHICEHTRGALLKNSVVVSPLALFQ